MRALLSLPLLVSAAACGAPAPDVSANAVNTANGYAAKVAALPDKLRGGVLLRAIRDAGQNCQQVVDQKRAGTAAWVATCEDHGQWVIAVADDGTATVADARDVARRR